MNTLSLIGTGAAFLNYRKAKAEYDALKDKQEALLAAISTYENTKWDEYDKKTADPGDVRPAGLLVSSIVRVANLVGKVMKMRTSIVFTNTSDSPITINYVEAECSVLGTILIPFKSATNQTKVDQFVRETKTIAPKGTLEIQLPGGISSLGEQMGNLRDLICEAAGKKLITSCPKISIEGAETAKIYVEWSGGHFFINGKPGVLRYCGEAGL